MKNVLRRFLMLATGLAGLLALFAEPAHAHIVVNHCEPQPLDGGRR